MARRLAGLLTIIAGTLSIAVNLPAGEAARMYRDAINNEAIEIAARPEDAALPKPTLFHRTFKLDLALDSPEAAVGDPIGVSFVSDRNAYIYIFLMDGAGRSRQIFPNYFDRDNFVRGGVRRHVPSRPSVRFEAPAGRQTFRILAYPEKHRATQPWREALADDPFPLSPLTPEQMEERIGKEIEAANPIGSRSVEFADNSKGLFVHFATIHVPSTTPRAAMMQPTSLGRFERSTIDVRSIAGAAVYIDGVYRGRGPGLFPVNIGNRAVRVVEPITGEERRFTIGVFSPSSYVVEAQF